MTEPAPPSRGALIGGAVRRWIEALTDLGGRNTLLYYRDLRIGTLDLEGADPVAVEQLLAAKKVRLSRLFTDDDARADAAWRARAIHRKDRELTEERGINAAYLAIGMASWAEEDRSPAAPVLLRPLALTPTGARQDDFDLVLDDTTEVNPVMAYKLNTDFGASIDPEQVAELLPDGPHDPGPVFERLRKLARAADVPRFNIADRRILGTFTYAKLPIVRDLESADHLLTDSNLVAALAGDRAAQTTLAADPSDDPPLDHLQPQYDYSVLDADSSQQKVINDVLRGQSLVIHGPPGTGKSQTIANLIAVLVAHHKKVLFVAEKRAAIDAVLDRLKRTDLADLVLDVHDRTRDRHRIARDLGTTLERASQTPLPDVARLHQRLADRQARLSHHAAALHEPRRPWGTTAFEAQSELIGFPEAARTNVRLRPLERLDEATADRVRDELREYTELGGFTLTPTRTPWYGATVNTREQAQQAYDIAVRLGADAFPAAREILEYASAETGLRPPQVYPEWGHRLSLYEGVRTLQRRFVPEIHFAQLARLAAATGPRRGRKGIGRRDRRMLRKEARSLWHAGKPARGELHKALVNAEQISATWSALRIDAGLPRVPSVLDEAVRRVGELDRELGQLRAFLPAFVPGSLVELEAILSALTNDQVTLNKLPRLHELYRHFEGLGLNLLLKDLARRNPSPEQAVQVFDHAWYASILDHVTVQDPRYSADSGNALDQTVTEFRTLDREHLSANQMRVRRAAAEHLIAAQDQHPQQALIIKKEANKQRRHLTLRSLVERTSDVLLELKPCWAMSPLMVSQILPQRRLFDVVIFDEASQVIPADAIPSIMRARHVVVAGDPHQLPPSNFFHQISRDPDEEDDDYIQGGEPIVAIGAGFESVLDTLLPLLPQRSLTWHYRSRDERLIAFSNAHIYNHTLTTFPGVFHDGCLSHVVVQQAPVAGQDVSVTAEVHRVVELILDHARSRPAESLGVIALGIKHSNRIEESLRHALRDYPDLEGFFAEDKEEPFFVKNLERVQGDERDAIILSIGYGKHADGRMLYRWGPLNNDGGERRLNVAVTRAKQRLTLISSFSRYDIDPARLRKAGAQLLCDYLEYTDSAGSSLGADAPSEVELNAFEGTIRERLVASGIPVIPQYGVGGYRIDFAAQHPKHPGRMVLAIEADGAQYHSTPTARDRDRLRQEHLARLGWKFHRIWSTNWFSDPDSEIAKVRAAYDRAVAEADGEESPATERPRRRPEASNPRPQRSLPRPQIVPGLVITEYDRHELVKLIRWIESDNLPRTKDEVLSEVMAELGFRKRGSRIVAAITEAIDVARRMQRG